MIEFVCSYYNTADEVVDVIYDNDIEKVLIVNTDTKETEVINDMKNMRLDMYCFMANDFVCFKEVNTEVMKIDEEEIEYIKDKCIDGELLIEEIKEKNIKIEEM